MVEPANDNVNQEEQVRALLMNLFGYIPEPRQIKDRGAHNEFFSIPDYHDDPFLLEEILEKTAQNAGSKSFYGMITDVADRKHGIAEGLQVFEIQDQQQLVHKYLNAYGVSAEDQQVIFTIQTINSFGGLDGYMNALAEDGAQFDANKLRTTYDTAKKAYDERGLEEKLQAFKKDENFKTEQVGCFVEQIGLDRAMSRYVAERLARTFFDFNKKRVESGEGEAKGLVGGIGNHDSRSEIGFAIQHYNRLLEEEGIEGMSNATEVLFDPLTVHGLVELGEEGDDFRFQYASNCPTPTGIMGLAYGQVEGGIELFFPQFANSAYIRGLNPEEIQKMGPHELMNQSPELQRMLGVYFDKHAIDNTLSRKAHRIFFHQEPGDNVPDYEFCTQKENLVTDAGALFFAYKFAERDENGNVKFHAGHFHKDELEPRVDETWRAKIYRRNASIVGATDDSYQPLDIRRTDPQFDWNRIAQYATEENMKMAQVFGVEADYKKYLELKEEGTLPPPGGPNSGLENRIN